MTKRYIYTKREQQAEREIDRFLQGIAYRDAPASVLRDLQSLAAGK